MGRLGDGGTRLRAEALQRAGTEKKTDREMRGWRDAEKKVTGKRGDKERQSSHHPVPGSPLPVRV
jgi:hypothetical protein